MTRRCCAGSGPDKPQVPRCPLDLSSPVASAYSRLPILNGQPIILSGMYFSMALSSTDEVKAANKLQL